MVGGAGGGAARRLEYSPVDRAVEELLLRVGGVHELDTGARYTDFPYFALICVELRLVTVVVKVYHGVDPNGTRTTTTSDMFVPKFVP